MRGSGPALALVLLLAAAAPAAEPGRGLYLRHCAECHGLDSRGDGPIARHFDRPAANLRSPEWRRSSDEALARFVREGTKARLAVRPEALRQQARRVESLYRFLTRIPQTDWERVEAGEDLFLARCVACHDPYGRPREDLPPGVRPPRDLSRPSYQASVDDEELVRRIRHGRGSMPSLVPPLGETEARALLPYVRFLSPGFRLYDLYCASCHGLRGGGAPEALLEFPAPRFAFDEEYFAKRDPEAIRTSIWHMAREESRWMPHFAAVLSEAEVRTILEHLRSLPAVAAPDDSPNPKID